MECIKYLRQDNMVFVILHKTTNKPLKNMLWQLFHHCYRTFSLPSLPLPHYYPIIVTVPVRIISGSSIITAPALLPYHSYRTRENHLRFSRCWLVQSRTSRCCNVTPGDCSDPQTVGHISALPSPIQNTKLSGNISSLGKYNHQWRSHWSAWMF